MDLWDLPRETPTHDTQAATDGESGAVDDATQTDDIGDELYCSTREAGCHVVIGVPGLDMEPSETAG
jgi:hypothetical protein